ncbi:O-antigen ligase family protein [Paenibacillus sp. BK720]|uniref:O-antigen ligase family protein n=1 Tax=Paenibacillus sp. BK720 TaxID=2587092 RepID=UPI001422B593|nr:O-antigen ligase family protein [Paenibacillus sp. BK720]NIK69244.1 hypothetical protein [Paenibacillus sp. BK720]
MLNLSLKHTAITLVFSAVMGVIIAINPLYMAAPIGALIIWLLTRSAVLRFIYIVIGSLLVFQSSSNFGLQKVAFLIGIIVVTLISFHQTRPLLKERQYKTLVPVLFTSYVFGFYVIVCIVLSILRGANELTVIRDAAPYLIFSITPLLAFDFSKHIKRSVVTKLFILVGIYATISCSYGWIVRRGITDADSGMTSIGFPSFMLSFAFFIYCCALALRGKHKVFIWTILSAFTIAALLITGTRSTFLALIGPLVILLSGKGLSYFKRFQRGVYVSLIFILSFFVGVSLLLSVTNIEKEKFYERISMIGSVFDKKSRLNDYSYIERTNQTEATLLAFKESPIVGMGPGYIFKVKKYNGVEYNYVSLDSKYSIMAKYGMLGYLILVVWLWNIYVYLRRSSEGRVYTLNSLTIIGYISIVILCMVISVPIEDKGYGIAFLLLFVLKINENRNSELDNLLNDGNNSK